jgi:hypothetical protein
VVNDIDTLLRELDRITRTAYPFSGLHLYEPEIAEQHRRAVQQWLRDRQPESLR